MAFKWARAAIAAAFLASAGYGAFVTTADARAAAEQVQWPQAAGALKPEKNILWGQLPNGLRYAIMANKTPTKSVALRLRIGAGSLDETDAQKGLAHFLEHMAFNGSAKVPEGEIVKSWSDMVSRLAQTPTLSPVSIRRCISSICPPMATPLSIKG